jgi:putative transposase
VSRYRFIAAEKATYPVSLLCRVLGVSRASFYAWQDRGPSVRAQADQQLLKQISKIHRASRGTYGAHACMPSSATTTGCGPAASGSPG